MTQSVQPLAILSLGQIAGIWWHFCHDSSTLHILWSLWSNANHEMSKNVKKKKKRTCAILNHPFLGFRLVASSCKSCVGGTWWDMVGHGGTWRDHVGHLAHLDISWHIAPPSGAKNVLRQPLHGIGIRVLKRRLAVKSCQCHREETKETNRKLIGNKGNK